MVKINLSILVFCSTTYLATLKMYKKFEDSGCHRSREICNRKFDWRENGKRRQKLISAPWFSFPQHSCPLSRCIQNLKTLALIEAEKSVTEIFIGEKEKWTNNGNEKQEAADSLLHNTTSYTQHLYNPRFSSSWENFDEKKVYTQTHTPTLLLKRQKLYTPYILRIPGV